jgi:hypothetical protein
MGLSMHSNSHLGVSLAAMVHLAAASKNLTYACDTHYPWKTQDVVVPGTLDFRDGEVSVPTGPGLGIELDRERLGELHSSTLRAVCVAAKTRHTCSPSSRASCPTPHAGSSPRVRTARGRRRPSM